MAVGDLVRQRDLAWDREIIRIPGSIEGDLVKDKLFQAPALPRRPGRVSRFWHRLARRGGGEPETEALSLLQLLDQRHDIVTYGTPSAGRETVAVPFTHVVLLTATTGRFSGGLSADHRHEIEAAILDRFDQNIDPMTSVRIGSASSPTVEPGTVLAYFGRGIFVPKDGERPVGRVRVGSSLERLVEPSLLGSRPAGLYRGQSALAFASSLAVAPATVRLGVDDTAWFYLEGATGAGDTLALTPHEVPAMEPSREATSADALWRIELAHAQDDARYADRLFIEVTLDERPSRFLRSLPLGRPAFEIAGLRIGDDDIRGGTEAFWIDLDVDGYPLASAMTVRDASIVHDGRRTRRYSWRSYDYDSEQGAGFAIARDRDGWVFRPTSGRPLGYLAAPPEPTMASFQANWWTSPSYHLDWLDFCGCVENGTRIQGLADAHAHRPAVVMPSFATAPADEFPIGPLILRRSERDRP
ncbi:hypothetical protein ACQVP2_18135 [Methylobacterium aquaticum]|uniref:hypothetical protein n=1 Tax=Methylobacterium aquaticum TaxID=270351 RepID=UPI003D16EAEB